MSTTNFSAVLFALLFPCLLSAQNDDDPVSGPVGIFETALSVPVRDGANIDYEGFGAGRGIKLGAGYQFEFGTVSLNWRRIGFAGRQQDYSNPNGVTALQLSANVFGINYDGYTAGRNKFHYALGLTWGNHIYRAKASDKGISVASKVKIKSDAGFGCGLGYARQLTPNLRLTADASMDAIGIYTEKDPFTGQLVPNADAMFFHFAVGVQYCLDL